MGGRIWSAVTEDQDIATIFINFSKAFDHPGPFEGPGAFVLRKLKHFGLGWASADGFASYLLTQESKREKEGERESGNLSPEVATQQISNEQNFMGESLFPLFCFQTL